MIARIWRGWAPLATRRRLSASLRDGGPGLPNAYGVDDYLLGQIGLALLLGVCNDHLARPLAPHPAALGG